LSGAYINRREDLRLAERGGDRVGVRLLDDHVRAPVPPFLDDHRFVSQSGGLPSSNRLTLDEGLNFRSDHHRFVSQSGALPSSNQLTVDEGLNFRSDSHRLDPVIRRRVPVDDVQYLPEDASNTLFVMGVPSDCTSREVEHIFRPFRGFKEVRVVKKPKEAKKYHGGGEGEAATAVVVLCFVEFDNPKCAAIAMEVLQGYKFDENDRDSPSLKLQFDRERSRSSFAHDQDRRRDYDRHRR